LKQLTLKEQEKNETRPDQKKRKRRNNELHFDVQAYLQQMTGVDLTKIDGLDTHSVLKIISEVGMDMSKWPSAKHFGSWLGLAPGTKILCWVLPFPL
jgi:hypothetical protein